MGKSTLLIDLHYLPSLEYFTCLLPYPTIILEAHEHYQKQSYRNRCYILTAQKVDRLTIPVLGGRQKIKYRDIKVDYSQKWSNIHWRTLCIAYSKAPYFAYFMEYFHSIFLKKYKFLFDFNIEILLACFKLLQLEKKIELSSCYEKEVGSSVVDARAVIHPKTDFRKNKFYQPFCYQQVYSKEFVTNLSIIDLLFCEGHHAYTILKESVWMKSHNKIS
ncbi:MAG: WbqC family protein [Cytophagales bacterium]|nr:WbqC family protein [Cytophagales bacterium]